MGQDAGTVSTTTTVVQPQLPAADRPLEERRREAADEADKVAQQLMLDEVNRRFGEQPAVDRATRLRNLKTYMVQQLRLTNQQANETINKSLSSGLYPGRTDADVRAAIAQEVPTAGEQLVASAPQESAQGDAGGQQQQSGLGRESRGAELARMERGQQVPLPSTRPLPRTPGQPQPQAFVATRTPPPNAPLPRPDGVRGEPQPLVIDGVPQAEAPLLGQGAEVPGDLPVVPTRTADLGNPETPRRPQGMQGESRTVLGRTDPRGVLPSDEALDNFHTTAVRAQFMLRGGVPQAPVPVPVRTPNDTFVARTREPAKPGEKREGGDRVGGEHDRALALGMRRQFRDTAC